MKIRNSTKDREISDHGELCSDLFSKFRGLMFRQRSSAALIFVFNKETRISLHMVFVFYPIDVLFLNRSREVVDMKEGFKPFTFYRARKGSMYAIELPAKTIRRTGTGIGDKIQF